MGETQLQWLSEQLDRRPDKPAIGLAHHYPLPGDDPEKLKSALLDTKKFCEIVLPRKRVKACLFGHSHRWEHAEVDDLHLVDIAARAWLFDPPQLRGRVDAQLTPGGIRLTLQCLDPSHEAHTRLMELAWRQCDSAGMSKKCR